MRIISVRGRAIQEKQNKQRRLEEKYQLSQLPLSEKEQKYIEKVFENFRRQLDASSRKS